jgi:hypothetical protein
MHSEALARGHDLGRRLLVPVGVRMNELDAADELSDKVPDRDGAG